MIPTDRYLPPGVRTEVSESFLHTYFSGFRLDADDHKFSLVNEAGGSSAALDNNKPCGLRRVDVELSLEQ